MEESAWKRWCEWGHTASVCVSVSPCCTRVFALGLDESEEGEGKIGGLYIENVSYYVDSILVDDC